MNESTEEYLNNLGERAKTFAALRENPLEDALELLVMLRETDRSTFKYLEGHIKMARDLAEHWRYQATECEGRRPEPEDQFPWETKKDIDE